MCIIQSKKIMEYTVYSGFETSEMLKGDSNC
jgi:hypothetical protein